MRARRQVQDMTQQELADLSGVNLMMVNRYENGHILPSIESLLAIAHALDVSVDYLVAATDDPKGAASALSSFEQRLIANARRRDISALLREIATLSDQRDQGGVAGGNQRLVDSSTETNGE